MINLGTVGTNWITSSFVDAAHATGKYRLTQVCSRTQTAAQAFASKYSDSSANPSSTSTASPQLSPPPPPRICTSVEELASTDVDVVYIASPNSLHHSQAKTVLSHGKHVILEKPATSTPAELDELFALAHAHNVYLFEAFRHLHEANFLHVERVLTDDAQPLGRIYGASLTYASFSSRYADVLDERKPVPNIFSLDFSGGSLVDLGCYCLAFAVALFGAPTSQTYAPVVCRRTGVDLGGPVVLHYPDFAVQINQAKAYTSRAPTEIYGEHGTLTLNGTTDIDIDTAVFWDRRTRLAVPLLALDVGTMDDNDNNNNNQKKKRKVNNLQDEADEFARVIVEKDDVAAVRLEVISRQVIAITSDLRRQNGILFRVEREAGLGSV